MCVKVTEEDGSHTKDREWATDLYLHLMSRGYKPFFSEQEMKLRTGSDHEALILYALYTSECMLIVCSDEDYAKVLDKDPKNGDAWRGVFLASMKASNEEELLRDLNRNALGLIESNKGLANARLEAECNSLQKDVTACQDYLTEHA